MTFKALHNLAPSNLTYLLQLYQPTRTLRSSSDALLMARSARIRNYGDRQNSGTMYYSISGFVHSLKRLLKTHLFNSFPLIPAETAFCGSPSYHPISPSSIAPLTGRNRPPGRSPKPCAWINPFLAHIKR